MNISLFSVWRRTPMTHIHLLSFRTFSAISFRFYAWWHLTESCPNGLRNFRLVIHQGFSSFSIPPYSPPLSFHFKSKCAWLCSFSHLGFNTHEDKRPTCIWTCWQRNRSGVWPCVYMISVFACLCVYICLGEFRESVSM